MSNVAPAVPVTTVPTQDDRLLAAAAHLSMFAGLPVVGPAAIYVIKRKESHFAAFHALQAAIAHVLFGAIATVGFFVFVIASAIIGIAAASRHELAALIGVVPLFAFLAMGAALIGVHLYAAYVAWGGEVWSIPIAGRIARAIQSSDEGAAKG
jgi:uncharacterized membrane protein